MPPVVLSTPGRSATRGATELLGLGGVLERPGRLSTEEELEESWSFCETFHEAAGLSIIEELA